MLWIRLDDGERHCIAWRGARMGWCIDICDSKTKTAFACWKGIAAIVSQDRLNEVSRIFLPLVETEADVACFII